MSSRGIGDRGGRVVRPSTEPAERRIAALLEQLMRSRTELRVNLEAARRHTALVAGAARALYAAAEGPRAPAPAKASWAAKNRLPRRQRQIFERVTRGQPNKVIAFELGVSPKTIETHRARLMQKLGVRSFAELMRISVYVLGLGSAWQGRGERDGAAVG